LQFIRSPDPDECCLFRAARSSALHQEEQTDRSGSLSSTARYTDAST
jgi:hypothetical protein